MCARGSSPSARVLFGGEEMLTLRGVSTTLCRNWREGALRLVVQFACGFRAVCVCAVLSAVRFVLDISGGKLSFSGRTGLDLGRVCGVQRGFDSEVCCVVLYQSLLVASSGVAVEVRIVFVFLCKKVLGF